MPLNRNGENGAFNVVCILAQQKRVNSGFFIVASWFVMTPDSRPENPVSGGVLERVSLPLPVHADYQFQGLFLVVEIMNL